MATNTAKRKELKIQNKDRRPFAIAKYIRIAPGKVDIVLDLIRGKNYPVAVAILLNCPKSAALPVRKCLESAGANAEVNLGLDKENLFVAECYTGQGPTLKRIQENIPHHPGPQGSGITKEEVTPWDKK
jgi:large subunit ribosomal protein L22